MAEPRYISGSTSSPQHGPLPTKAIPQPTYDLDGAGIPTDQPTVVSGPEEGYYTGFAGESNATLYTPPDITWRVQIMPNVSFVGMEDRPNFWNRLWMRFYFGWVFVKEERSTRDWVEGDVE